MSLGLAVGAGYDAAPGGIRVIGMQSLGELIRVYGQELGALSIVMD
jgi:hypothetical protein